MTGLTTETAPRTSGTGSVRDRVPRPRAWLAGGALVAAALLTGCSGGSGGGPTGAGGAPSSAAPSSAARSSAAASTAPAADTSGLTATGWKLTDLLSGGAATPVDPTLNGWVRFAPSADGLQVAFNTTCNRGGGSATVAGDEMTFGPQRVTLIYCDGPSGTTETAMLALLNGPRSFRLDEAAGTLSITSTDGTSGLGFAADPTVGADAFTDGLGSPSIASSSAGG